MSTAKGRFPLVAIGAAICLLAACGSSAGTGGSLSAPSSSSNESSSGSNSSGTSTENSSQQVKTSQGTNGSNFSYSKNTEEACSAASKSGKPVKYGAATDPSVFAKEIQPFKEKYPNIDISYSTTRGTDSTQQILAQQQAGKAPSFDITAGVISDFTPLFDQDLVANVDWKALGIDSDLVYTLENGNAWRNYRLALGIGYNTERYSASDLPDTWEELIDPKWKGDVIVDPRGEYLAGLGIVWGKDKAIAWFKKFMTTDHPIVLQGATASSQKVLSGEVSITTSAADANVAESKAAGAPLGIKYLDVVGTSDYHTLIPRHANNIDGAACLASWLASDEGMSQIAKYEFKQNRTRPEAVPTDAKLAVKDSPDSFKTFADTAQEMVAIMGK